MSEEFQILHEKSWYYINEKFGSGSGVYKLFCKDSTGRRIPAPWVMKIDKSGILYIGKVSNFHDRIIDLKKSLHPDNNSSSHFCGVRYKSSSELQKKIPYKNLYIELSVSDDFSKLEKEELNKYLVEFHELPPLNRNL
ncbi:hypothetical protein [Maribacter aestuarii]|uniref:hypothetical protein n=1 Tax=Maribacter aestuarii TaxID=1130723 RepID=UPI00248BD901|nr:hypothetical protein [Maribacter aestuarii]